MLAVDFWVNSDEKNRFSLKISLAENWQITQKFRTLDGERVREKLLTIITYMLVRLTVKIFSLKFPCFFNKTYCSMYMFVLCCLSALLCVDAYSSSIKLISNLEAKISYNVFVGKFHACMDPFKILMPTKSLLNVYLCNSNSVDLTTVVAMCKCLMCMK